MYTTVITFISNTYANGRKPFASKPGDEFVQIPCCSAQGTPWDCSNLLAHPKIQQG